MMMRVVIQICVMVIVVSLAGGCGGSGVLLEWEESVLFATPVDRAVQESSGLHCLVVVSAHPEWSWQRIRRYRIEDASLVVEQGALGRSFTKIEWETLGKTDIEWVVAGYTDVFNAVEKECRRTARVNSSLRDRRSEDEVTRIVMQGERQMLFAGSFDEYQLCDCRKLFEYVMDPENQDDPYFADFVSWDTDELRSWAAACAEWSAWRVHATREQLLLSSLDGICEAVRAIDALANQ